MLSELVGRLGLEQKVRLLTGADFWSLHPEPAVGLRRLVVSDGPAGVRGELWDERETSANVPSPTALAATWDERRIEPLGALLSAEARRKGVDVLLAPTVNLHRTPYGGRHFECFSEDPYLTGRIGVAYVRGVQRGGVGATVKHFVANDAETERFTVDVRVDERVLHELYMAPFEAIVREAGVWSVMAAYNSVNGSTMTESPLLREVLQSEWDFDGVTMSDWYAARSLAAAATGLDLVMPGPHGPWGDALVTAVREGKIDESVVDDKVRRLLRLAARVGALEAVGVPGGDRPVDGPTGDQVAAELRSAAAAGFVLVRNEAPSGASGPVLPLNGPALRRVAVLGPNAAVARTLGGGSATVFPPYTVSPLDGLRAALSGGVQVDYAVGVRSHTRVPAAPVELLEHPDGGAGIDVRFLGPDGEVLGRERRNITSFNWAISFLPELPISDVATVEVRSRLRAKWPGRYVVGCSGVGRFRLDIDGSTMFDADLRLAPGDDPVVALMTPPQETRFIGLNVGDAVELVLRYHVELGGFGSFEVASTNFQLNVEPPHEEDDDAIQRAVALAADADVAVVVVGTTEEVESEGFDRTSLALPGRQDELVRRVAAANPRTVVVVNAGAPVLLPWAEDVPAVLVAWFPGQEFGNALADALLGVVEPGGRLPVSWPASEDRVPGSRPTDGTLDYREGLFIGYRGYDRDGQRPQYCFGHGLGYTAWEYLGADVPAQVDEGDDVVVPVRVRNTEERAGREVVQVYASHPGSALERPDRWLVGFATVEGGPGEEVTAAVHVPARGFAHWDVDQGHWAVEPGTRTLHVGHSLADLPLHVDLEVRPRPPAR